MNLTPNMPNVGTKALSPPPPPCLQPQVTGCWPRPHRCAHDQCPPSPPRCLSSSLSQVYVCVRVEWGGLEEFQHQNMGVSRRTLFSSVQRRTIKSSKPKVHSLRSTVDRSYCGPRPRTLIQQQFITVFWL